MFYVKRSDGGGGGDSNGDDNSVVKQKIHLHIIAHTHKQANTLCADNCV